MEKIYEILEGEFDGMKIEIENVLPQDIEARSLPSSQKNSGAGRNLPSGGAGARHKSDASIPARILTMQGICHFPKA